MAKNTTDPKDGAEQWQDRYDLAVTNQTKMFQRFSQWYDALYAVPPSIPSPWRSKPFMPILARQTWNLIAKFLNLQPGFEVRTTDVNIADQDVSKLAEKAQKLLEHDYNNPIFDESIRDKLAGPLLDAVVAGTGLAKVPWCVKEITSKRRIAKYGTIDLSKEKVITKTVGYNDLEPVNIFNVFVSPMAKNLYDAPWLIIREEKPLSELEEINRVKKVYTNLDKVATASGTDQFSSYDAARNRLLSQTDKGDKTVDTVTVYECYEGDMILTYAQGESTKPGDKQSWVLIRKQQNPYWHGKYPLVRFVIKKKPYSFWGEGLFETTYRLQAIYNDVFAHYLDAWNLSNDPMLITPENANINPYVVAPGNVITYRGDQAPQAFKHAAPDPNQLQTIVGLLDQSVEGSTFSQYATGMPNSSTDKTQGTATGIMRLQDAAGDIISYFRSNFTQSILQIGRMWLSNNQQFLTAPVTIVANNKGKLEPLQVDPLDLQFSFDVMVDEASMQPTSKEDDKQNALAFIQQLLQIKQVADAQHATLGTQPVAYNPVDLIEFVSDKFGVKGVESIIMSEEDIRQAQQQAMQQAVQALGAQTPQGAPDAPQEAHGTQKESISINYKDAPEDIKRQMEATAGFTPSQTISPEGTKQLQAHDTMATKDMAPKPQAPFNR